MAEKFASAEEAFVREEDRYSRFRTKTLKPPQVAVIKADAADRGNIRRKIAASFLFNFNKHGKRFDDSPTEISKESAHIIKSVLKRHLNKFDRFSSDPKSTFLILRGFLKVPFGFPETEYKFRKEAGEWSAPVRKKRQREMRTIDATLGGILSVLGSTPSHRTIMRRNGYDLTTRWDIQQTFDAPRPDMPLRFHQSVVERPLPGPNRQPGSTTTATYVVYGAIRNPRRVPVLLVTVDDVLDALRDVCNGDNKYTQVMADLQREVYEKEFPRLAQYAYNLGTNSSIDRIISPHGNFFFMSYDSSLVWVSRQDERRGMEAINMLRLAIERASFTNSYEIKLRQGDVLLVKNMRALVARSEDAPSLFDPMALPILNKFSRRWLREMHGFADRSDFSP
jgi:hypothetical protein